MSSPACRTRARPAAAARIDLVFRRRVDVYGDERLAAGVANLVALTGFDQEHFAGFDADRAAVHDRFTPARDDVEPLVGARVDVVVPAGGLPGLSTMVAACDRSVPATT